MEQAINTFSEGLQMDIHPLMQSDKVLSDALNATINTMNGNECILQNDMGNRRVDNAFLPAGYEPVGIKEYGGIIYVASYNPITNKSQIGSFPSPERRIGMNDSNNGGSLDIEYILSENNTSKIEKLNYLPCIKSDSILSPITNGINLHGGDKFVVYTTDSNFFDFANEFLSNYNNTENGKIKTPKNKLYTLSLGVLNSQNEFVDITKNLVRWDNEGNIIQYENQSDLYKFNDGYFISESDYTEDYSETISDANLIEERKTLPANTYAYKLVGPLYLKLQLNHITNFNYNIYGIKTSNEGEYTIWIEGQITYNCPDGESVETESGDEDYITYDEHESYMDGFNLLKTSLLPSSISFYNIISPDEDEGGITYSKSKYNKQTNTYQCTIIKKYTIIPASETQTYTLGVVAGRIPLNDPEHQVGILDYGYIEELSNRITIDFSLFGSNTVKLKEWRFKNDFKNKLSTLTYAFDAYPKYGESFSNLVFKFVDATLDDPNPDYKLLPAQLNNGRTTMMIDWAAIGLEPRKLYKVSYTFDSTDSTITPSNEYVEWLLTTELFNDWYSQVSDYGNPPNGYNKDEIQVSLKQQIKENSIKNNLKEEGHFYNFTNTLGSYKIINRKIIELLLTNSIEFKEDLYPDYVICPNNIRVYNENPQQSIDQYTITYVNPTEEEYSDLSLSSGVTPTFNNNILNIDSYLEDGINGKYNLGGKIINGFTSINGDVIDIYASSSNNKYGMICPDFEEYSVHRDDHYIYVFTGPMDEERTTYDDTPSGVTREADRYQIEYDYGNHIIGWRYSKNKSLINDRFNLFLGDNTIFSFGFEKKTSGQFPFIQDTLRKSSSGWNMHTNARIWWRTSKGEWALLPEIITIERYTDQDTIPQGKSVGDIKTSIYTIFQSIFAQIFNNSLDYIYAFYKSKDVVTGQGSKNFLKGKYNQEYQVDYTITWDQCIDAGEIRVGEINSNNFIGTYIPDFQQNRMTVNRKYDFYNTSSDKYLDLISNINSETPTFENLFIDGGQFISSDEKQLNVNYIYKRVSDNGQDKVGERINDNKLFVSEEYAPSSEYRGILYNKDDLSVPKYQYDFIKCSGDHDSDTYEQYDKVIVVEPYV